ncbi:hypothetical protein [Oscillatoria acuminata]|nr:hypothetical protein [Oscillatoria acuminata]
MTNDPEPDRLSFDRSMVCSWVSLCSRLQTLEHLTSEGKRRRIRLTPS